MALTACVVAAADLQPQPTAAAQHGEPEGPPLPGRCKLLSYQAGQFVLSGIKRPRVAVYAVKVAGSCSGFCMCILELDSCALPRQTLELPGVTDAPSARARRRSGSTSGRSRRASQRWSTPSTSGTSRTSRRAAAPSSRRALRRWPYTGTRPARRTPSARSAPT